MLCTGHVLPPNVLATPFSWTNCQSGSPQYKFNLYRAVFSMIGSRGRGGGGRLYPGTKILVQEGIPPSSRGSEEAETAGRAALANQFLAGLHPELKGKLAGQKGTFHQLLARNHFEEAKLSKRIVDGEAESGVVVGKVIGKAAPEVLHRDHIPAPRVEDSR